MQSSVLEGAEGISRQRNEVAAVACTMMLCADSLPVFGIRLFALTTGGGARSCVGALLASSCMAIASTTTLPARTCLASCRCVCVGDLAQLLLFQHPSWERLCLKTLHNERWCVGGRVVGKVWDGGMDVSDDY